MEATRGVGGERATVMKRVLIGWEHHSCSSLWSHRPLTPLVFVSLPFLVKRPTNQLTEDQLASQYVLHIDAAAPIAPSSQSYRKSLLALPQRAANSVQHFR